MISQSSSSIGPPWYVRGGGPCQTADGQGDGEREEEVPWHRQRATEKDASHQTPGSGDRQGKNCSQPVSPTNRRHPESAEGSRTDNGVGPPNATGSQDNHHADEDAHQRGGGGTPQRRGERRIGNSRFPGEDKTPGSVVCPVRHDRTRR
ncbi:hypothetical protein GCM10011608_60720 [Micromonospora sonchi]|uniref:Uncharacterized protein n=1 Tax=Micromonospora sonchi TaxID=1763543 RepID=A0A917U953_9ACTN|nr:hypothetical protein GCM10011608_60720 [Micromonospora sonchi]